MSTHPTKPQTRLPSGQVGGQRTGSGTASNGPFLEWHQYCSMIQQPTCELRHWHRPEYSHSSSCPDCSGPLLFSDSWSTKAFGNNALVGFLFLSYIILVQFMRDEWPAKPTDGSLRIQHLVNTRSRPTVLWVSRVWLAALASLIAMYARGQVGSASSFGGLCGKQERPATDYSNQETFTRQRRTVRHGHWVG